MRATPHESLFPVGRLFILPPLGVLIHVPCKAEGPWGQTDGGVERGAGLGNEKKGWETKGKGDEGGRGGGGVGTGGREEQGQSKRMKGVKAQSRQSAKLFSSRRNLDSPPTPHPQASVPPSRFCMGGGTHSLSREVLGLHCGTLYIYVRTLWVKGTRRERRGERNEMRVWGVLKDKEGGEGRVREWKGGEGKGREGKEGKWEGREKRKGERREGWGGGGRGGEVAGAGELRGGSKGG